MRLIDDDVQAAINRKAQGRNVMNAAGDVMGIIDEKPTVDNRELLPCPFCGGKALGPTDAWPHTIACEQCWAAVKGFGYGEDGMKEAVEKWNRREVSADG